MTNHDRPTESSRASVLVVDDTPANLVALGVVLAPLGVRVVEARSGVEALQLAARESFAVVVLDVQMPDMDGFEVARRLRELETGVEVPILFVTAIHRDEGYVRQGYAVGAADYITKPLDPDVLLARVKAFVDLYHQRERVRVTQVGERTKERDAALEQLAALLESERAARREAEMANATKDEFLASASHELRTPLSAILGWASIAKRYNPGPEVERVLATIERNARAQMRIIEDVLDVGRITSGKLRLEITTASVVDAVDGAVQVVRPAAEAKRLTLDVDVPSDVGTIPADPERLQQVVWNLLSNSIKFTPAGGRIRVAAARTESSVLLRVQDDGQGIRPEFLPHLFEPFRQGDGSTTRRHGGLGLGLAIVRQLVQAHGGQITVHSDGEGKGALFTVDLPARPAPRESDKMPTRPPSAAGSPRASRRVRLDGVRALIVDDDDDSREFLELMLADQGAIVMSASSAGEALARIARDRPDVLVSDIGMPDVSGYALIRRVRSLPESDGGRTPAIALTAYARAVDGERAFSAGFQAHVAKPVDAERLTAVVANLAGLSARASRDSHSLTGGSSRPGR